MNVAAVLGLMRHLIEHGCKDCGEKPTPATIRDFCTKVETTADGEIGDIKHQCRRCKALEN